VVISGHPALTSHLIAVEPHSARLKLGSHTFTPLWVSGEDSMREAVGRVVSERDSLFLALKALHA